METDNFRKPDSVSWGNSSHHIAEEGSSYIARLQNTLIDYPRELSYPTPFQFSPLLPLLLISLMSQKHTPLTKKTFKSEYDYIIVGAGAAGSVVASRLSEIECINVLLLEAGKPAPLIADVPAISRSFFFTDIDWAYLTAPQRHTARALKNRQVIWPSGKGIGGSTLFNAMLYIRGNQRDYDLWKGMGATAWGWKDVFRYFKKAEDNQDPEFVANGFHGVGGPMTVKRFPTKSEFIYPALQAQKNRGYPFVDINGPTQIGSADYQGNIRNGQRCNAAKAYLVPAENRTNLDIVPEAFVTKILIKDRTAYGVQFVHNGKNHIVKAKKEVILSAGTVNSAQLLMLSGIGPAEKLENLGIPVVANLPVGLNFQDHSVVPTPFVVRGTVPNLAIKMMDPTNINEYITNRSGILASTEAIFALSFLKSNQSCSPPYEPDYELYMLEAVTEILKTQWNLKEKAYKQYVGPYENSTLVMCVTQLVRQQIPGYVSIRSTNAFDPPIIDPNYLAHKQDMKDMLSGIKTCHDIFTSPEMQRLGVEPFKTVFPGCEACVGNEMKLFECHAKSAVVTLSHEVGTAKMGDPADETTVVDPKLRVKEVNRLRVIDASIMPTIPAGNTWNIVAMIAEKASDMIKQLIRCR